MKKKLTAFLAVICCILACLALPGTVKAATSVKPGTVKMVSVEADECSNTIRIIWNKTTNATSYVVYLREASGGKWQKAGSMKSSERGCQITYQPGVNFQVGKEYACTVKAYNKNSKKYGNYDKKGIKFTILPETVKISGISMDKEKTGVKIAWKKSDRSEITRGNYCHIYRKQNGKWKKIGSVKSSVTTYTDSGKNAYKLKAVKEGTAVITMKVGNQVQTFTVIVASGNDYINKWVQNMARDIRMTTSNKETQLLLVSRYFVGDFSYANVYDMKTVIASQKGNCYSAGQVMVKVYQALGFKAKLRSAIHDNPKRYPQNMIMGSDHYNVEVVVNGSTYYLDASPEAHLVYLSSKTEVLEAYTDLMGNGWTRIQ